MSNHCRRTTFLPGTNLKNTLLNSGDMSCQPIVKYLIKCVIYSSQSRCRPLTVLILWNNFPSLYFSFTKPSFFKSKHKNPATYKMKCQ